MKLNIIFFATLATLTSAQAFAITTDQLRSKCRDWQTSFGTRQVSYTSKDIFDRTETSTIDVLPLPGGCVTNLDDATFSVYRTSPWFDGQLIYTVHLTKSVDESWAVARQNAEYCLDKIYQGWQNIYAKTGAQIPDSLRVKLINITRDETCPIQLEAVKNNILEFLGSN